ncbi:MAG TPA: SPOR domain-containing protein, partial [Methylomirabilota bacterium]|nr:SPOR domain-containing protein [Methylomirabilota bacterium]
MKAAAEKPVESVPTPATVNESKIAEAEIEEPVSKILPAAISPVTEPTQGAPIVVADAPKASVSPLQPEIKSTGEPKESGSPKPAAMEAAIEGENQEGKASSPTPTLMNKPEPRRVAPAQSGTTTATLEPQSSVAPTKQAKVAKEARQQAPASRPLARLPVEEKAGKSQPNVTAATEPARSFPANLGTEIRQEPSPTSTVKASTPDARQEPAKAIAVPGPVKTEVTPVETKSIAPPITAKPQTVIQEPSNNEQLALNKPKESGVEKTAPAKPVAGAVAAESIPMPELSRATPAPRVAPRSETKTEMPASASKKRELNVEKPSGEQVALLSKPPEPPLEKKAALVPLAQKALEGFVIQLAFSDKEKARHWAEAMQRRGYAVSFTEVGADGPLRVRLGNFAAREDAERQLLSLK